MAASLLAMMLGPWTAPLRAAPATQPALRQGGGVVQMVEGKVAVRAGRTAPAVRVRAVYRLALEPGAARVELWKPSLAGGVPASLVAGVEGSNVPVFAPDTAVPGLVGVVRLPPAAQARDTVSLVVAYVVEPPREEESGFDLRVPLVLPGARPAGPTGTPVVVEAWLPAEYRVTDAFPTVRREILPRGSEVRHLLRLASAPALLRMRGLIDDGTAAVDRAIDPGAVGLVVLLGLAGLIVLRPGRRAG